MQSIAYDQVKNKIIKIRDQQIIIDADVAELYGVKTKHVNEAVKNNPEKFPHDYIIELNIEEKNEPVETFDRFNTLKHSTGTIKGFTEKSLYMLATILKSPRAISTTLAIIIHLAIFKVRKTIKKTSKERAIVT